MSGLFITGVGTGVGKTLVMSILCHQLMAEGRSVSALKPVVSGFVEDDPGSDPAVILRSLGIAPTREAVAAIAPWRFRAPVSPHLAARREGKSVTLAEVVRFCRKDGGEEASIRLIEGAGGVMSPMTSDATCLDLIVELGEPAVLVTGTYLGALSHTLSALAAMRGAGVTVRAVIVSEWVESVGLAETVEGLRIYGRSDVPIYPLPALNRNPEGRWHEAPPLARICEAEHD